MLTKYVFLFGMIVLQIIEARREEAPHMLPPLMESYDDLTPSKLPAKLPYLMMDQVWTFYCAICKIVPNGLA